LARFVWEESDDITLYTAGPQVSTVSYPLR
jgi:hypothetical protein